MTRGDRGAMAIGPFGFVDTPAPRITAADTIGAGDVFTAALLAELLRRNALGPVALDTMDVQALRECLAFAATAAALNCARRGADPPTRPEVEKLLLASSGRHGRA